MRLDRRLHIVRLVALAVVWIVGLVAGLFALLGGAASFSCGDASDGLACSAGGPVVAVVLLLAVIATVTAVTVLTSHSLPGRLWAFVGGGLAVLTVCLLGAQALLATA